MKKLGNILFSRLVLIFLAIVIQFFWLATVLYQFSLQFTFINLGFRAVALILAIIISDKDGNAAGRMSWIFLILVAPIFGVTLYFVFGRAKLTKHTEERLERVNEELSPFLAGDEQVEEKIRNENKRIYNQTKYIKDWAGYPVCEYTKTEYYPSGEELFLKMLEAVKEAENFIFLEYFIFEDGIMLEQLLAALEEKVKQGVEVRMIYDDVGCISKLPAGYYKKMEARGIKCTAFNPFRPIMSIIMNNRDHRKILVVDGKTAFTGGINLADEYINQKERFGHWKDTAVMLKGEAVWNMTAMFLHMWNVITNNREDHSLEKYLPHVWHPEAFEGDGYIQPFCDSPLDNETVGENVYLNIINRAKRYVYICTPYLVIDNEMMTALCLAAKSGVDVRLMTPGIPDKKLVFLLTQSYYEQLLEAGVKIYEYQPGFLHAKSFVCDDEIAVVGTINLDYRSLYLHFEDGVWIYRNQVIYDIKKDFTDTLEYCNPVSLEFCRGRNIAVRAMQSILRLFAPML